MILLANVFPILQTVKDFVRPLSRKHRFKTSLDSQHVKMSQTLVKAVWENFYHIFSSLWTEMISQVPPWVKYGVLQLLVNTFTADDKNPVRDSENLPFPI